MVGLVLWFGGYVVWVGDGCKFTGCESSLWCVEVVWIFFSFFSAFYFWLRIPFMLVFVFFLRFFFVVAIHVLIHAFGLNKTFGSTHDRFWKICVAWSLENFGWGCDLSWITVSLLCESEKCNIHAHGMVNPAGGDAMV